MKYLKNKISIILPTFIIVAIFAFSNCHIVQADTLTYTPLEPNAFPGLDMTAAPGNFAGFLGNLFDYIIAIAVVLAVIMIIFGGIEYMTTDAWNKKEDGIKKINDALWGLGLALVSYLLLYTINPALVNFSGNIFVSGSGATQQTASAPATTASSNSGAVAGTATCPSTATQGCAQSQVSK